MPLLLPVYSSIQSQHTFRRWNLSVFNARRGMQRPRGRLEHCFRNVVLVAAVQIFDMQIEAAFLDECLEEFLDQLCLQIANACCMCLAAKSI